MITAVVSSNFNMTKAIAARASMMITTIVLTTLDMTNVLLLNLSVRSVER
jgi:hypothetical protein